ncbi:serine/threonine-protein kinase [uncultured Phascolarctobacterium sp.]|uniref:serine/threonine protein kinase n=1 Tax=uncultured Phascolarctobacterium sp. TaxID=512296 RepID=UPI0025F01632|nr:serine/threonine-protein kinase [uncultured Phascolarctobacterium sp.]
MQPAVDFMMNSYKRISLLKQDKNGSTELVLGADERIYIRKTLPYENHAYLALRELQAEQLLRIYQVLLADGKTYVIEEYISGTTLQELLDKRGPLAEAQVRDIAMQLTEALAVLHKQKIIHRDIKPANIILRENGQAVLIDFGAARILTREGARDTCILGTPYFAPPEQYGFSATDVRSDFYALGMTLRELLGDSYHGSLEQAIERCTEFDPKRRVASAAELQALLARRFRWRWQYAAAVAAVLLLLGGGYVLYASRTPALPIEPPQTEQKQETAAPQPDGKQKSAAPTEEGQQGEQQAAPKAAPQEQKPAAAPAPAEEEKWTRAASIDFTLQQTSFKRNEMAEKDSRKGTEPDGYKSVRSESDWLGVITNSGDLPLQNPVINLYFSEMLIPGNNQFSYDTWDEKKVHYKSDNVAGTNSYGAKFYSTAVISVQGTLLKNEQLRLLDGISIFSASSAQPSVRVEITADNAEKFVKTYQLTTDL